MKSSRTKSASTRPTLGEKLFGPRPYAEVVIGELDGEPQGFALFFHNFSTFEGRPGLYLEDLFVRPEARGSGLGKALLAHLAQLCVDTRLRAARMERARLERPRDRLLPEPRRQADGRMDRHARRR